ncbi:hypothetical protein FRC08_015617 [Ceratobasidium sp. 394]|nr:hypothetical protein FRC08_015617 [Ceratobasidium sp. 394]
MSDNNYPYYYPVYPPSSAPTAQHAYAHAQPAYARSYYDDSHSPSAPPHPALSDPHYYATDAYAMQRPYVHPYTSAEPPFAPGMYTQSPAQSQPSLPVQSHPMPYVQQNMSARNYYQRETLDKLHLHPHAHQAMMSVPSQPAASPVHPEPPPPERPRNGYPFVHTVPGPLSGPVLAPEFQQSLAYSRSPASTIPSTLPTVPSTSGPSSSRQSDSTGSISPRANPDSSLPAPVFSSTSPVVKQGDVLMTDPSVKNRKHVVERDITCIKCSSVIGHLLLRGTQEEFAHEYSLYFQFLGSRKTCRLSHARLGHGELEIGVWRTPQELKDQKDLLSVIASCKKLWQERVLGKLATPEVLEGDQEQPLRTYDDIERVLARGWPAHENLLLEFPPDAGLHKRYICLLWTKSKGRRNRKPNPTTTPVNADDPDQLAEGLRRTREFAPEGCTLVSIFVCDWNMQAGTVLVSTSVPFESQDAEDRGAVSMGEVLGQILKDKEEHNAKHPDSPVPPPLHLWVGTKAVSPVHGAKFIDSMNRRGFLSLSEYIARHPDVDAKMFDDPPFGHMWLVRWLGKDLDEAQLEKIKGVEYGKRAREAGRAKRRR